MRHLLCAVLLATAGCSGGVSESQVKETVQERQASLTAFRTQFDPLHHQLQTELAKPNFGKPEAYDQLGEQFDKIPVSDSGGLGSEETHLVTMDKLVCTEASLYFSPFIDADMKATSQKTMEQSKANTRPYAKLEHLASLERVRFELDSKPIDPSKIKIGAHVVDGESGNSVGYITNPEYKEHEKVFVVLGKTPDAQGTQYIERHMVERGVDYRIAN